MQSSMKAFCKKFKQWLLDINLSSPHHYKNPPLAFLAKQFFPIFSEGFSFQKKYPLLVVRLSIYIEV